MEVSDSRNGFVSRVFGPATWMILHMVSLNYPVVPTDEERQHYTDFFLGMQYVLPCRACRENFKKNLQDIGFDPSIDMLGRESFAKLVWRLHNKVNEMLNKDVYVTFEEMNSFYEELRASDCSHTGPGTEASCISSKTVEPAGCEIHVVPSRLAHGISIDDRCRNKDKKNKKYA